MKFSLYIDDNKVKEPICNTLSSLNVEYDLYCIDSIKKLTKRRSYIDYDLAIFDSINF